MKGGQGFVPQLEEDVMALEEGIKKFDGSTNLAEWLEVYELTI
jgi:hypothetical protein